VLFIAILGPAAIRVMALNEADFLIVRHKPGLRPDAAAIMT
jgi:hypothetical protein